MTEEFLRDLLTGEEDYDLELKSAKNTFSKVTVFDYCAALSNENGGYLLLGVNDSKKITGTNAFISNWNKLAHLLTEGLGIRIKIYKVITTEGRVLVFEIPRHITGTPTQVGGSSDFRYPIRDGESLVEMDQQTLLNIFAEKDNDWSAEIAKGVTIDDLDVEALIFYRHEWALHTRLPEREAIDFKTLLNDHQLMNDDEVSNAALLLFGTEKILARAIPDAEIIFEWRNEALDIDFGERRNWRAGFVLVKDQIWNAINARNTVFRYQEGFTQREISVFDEASIREAVVNAFAHRDYRIRGHSIIIKASPEKFFIENPGRLMPGVTLENILDKSVWRNRLLAESLEKVHIMERSSQGIDKIFRRTIESGKGLPSIVLTHDPSVELEIPVALKDQGFINFIEKVMAKYQNTLSVREIIELEQIRDGTKDKNITYKDKFLNLGIIERLGQGRGSRYILSHNYYDDTNDSGQHIRLRGLSREVKRTVVLEHLKKHGKVTNNNLQTAFTDMRMEEISTLLKGMKKDGLIVHEGPYRYGFWHILKSKIESESDNHIK